MIKKHKLAFALTLVLLLSLAIPSLALADGATGQAGTTGASGVLGTVAADLLAPRNPQADFATGGGWFLWPGSQDKTSFAFAVKVNPKSTDPRGNLLVIRHKADGTLLRLKSTTLTNLVIQDVAGCRLATFSGTGIYRAWDSGLKKYVSTDGVAFSVYARDCGEPGKGVDSFWVSGSADLVMTGPAESNIVLLGGGNIQVHAGAAHGNSENSHSNSNNNQSDENVQSNQPGHLKSHGHNH